MKRKRFSLLYYISDPQCHRDYSKLVVRFHEKKSIKDVANCETQPFGALLYAVLKCKGLNVWNELVYLFQLNILYLAAMVFSAT